jgi:hypothetical protein
MRTLHVFIISAAIVAAGLAFAQALGPANVNGCVVVSATPTYTAGQQVAFTCSTSGQLYVKTTTP